MPKHRKTAAAAALALIGATSILGVSAAQANCKWYANTALQQQKLNVDNKCGYTGPTWSSDRRGHLRWCAAVSPNQWKQQAQFRDKELDKCGVKR